jgi:predicted metal-dependent hydrolase
VLVCQFQHRGAEGILYLIVDYQHITHPRSRTIKIKVEPPGKVIVVTPPRFSSSRVDEFIRKSEPWIKRQLEKIKQARPFGETLTTVMVFGKQYKKNAILQNDQKIGVVVSDGELNINPVQLTEASISNELKRFLKSTAEKYIVTRTRQLAEKMGATFGTITLRQQKTRWGSCSSQGNLNFNWRLVHCPPAVIDYVIIHELAHRTQMNHSQKFWQIVERFDPEYRIHTGWLKRHGMTLG